MKKLIATLLSAALCAALLAACSSGSSSAAPGSGSAPASGGETTELRDCTLTYYYWNEPQKATTDAIIAEFNEIYPNIKIEATIVPFAQYWTKLQTSLPAGAGPDIFQINAAHAVDYVSAGLLAPLDEYIERDGIDMNNYVPGITALYNFDGVQYAMPKDYDSIALFYNKALFDAVGVDYPSSDWTWDDMLAAAKELTIPGQQYGFAVDSYLQTGIGNFIFQNGGKVFEDGNAKSAINSPENVETFQFLHDLLYVDKVSPSQAELVETPAYMQFQAGQIAMLTYGSWYATPFLDTMGDDLGVAELPMKETRASILHGLGFAMSKDTEYAEEAWAFIKFCSEQEAMQMQTADVLPAYIGMEDAWVDKYTTLDASAFSKAVDYGVPLPVAATNAAKVEEAMYVALDHIWNDDMSVEDALALAEQDMNSALEAG